ncbi:hypothetical protein EYC80_005185 [Monilinia laxa]|uniref:Uncharacterized protein n=1 Tax=Monilinia laxa TaxID=61186 RepID=A0A5N6KJQ0_MONLA|nr:hypothetical protein EYC80_005185 [Monilinia laxa]
MHLSTSLDKITGKRNQSSGTSITHSYTNFVSLKDSAGFSPSYPDILKSKQSILVYSLIIHLTIDYALTLFVKY